MAKDSNNDLADLFKAALDDEETRHASGNGRAPKAAAPGGNRTKPPAKVNSAAARAPTAALPAKPSIAPSPADTADPIIPPAVTRPTKPSLRSPSRSELEGLVAIPRSEANTVGRVNAYEGKGQQQRSTPSVSIPPRSVSKDPDATQQTLPPQGVTPKAAPASATKTPAPSMPKSTGTMSLPPSGRKGTNASEIRGRPANELTLPPGDASEQLDHKGRSRPIYAPRTPRPSQKRTKPGLDFLLGLFPGARLMADEQVGAGLAYALIGLLSLLPAVVVSISWSARAQAVTKLNMDPSWLVLHAGAALVSVLLYELVRSASSMNVDRGRVRASRWLAALFLPSVAAVLMGPGLVGLAPGPVEAAWLVAIPLAAISVVAAVDAVRARTETDAGRRSTGLTALFLGLSLVGGLLALALSVELNASVAKRAESAGFVKLPLIVRAVRISV